MRFDYIAFDEGAQNVQALFKEKFEDLEMLCETLQEGRAKSLIMTKLEEAYMWIGRAIHDEQVTRGYRAQLNDEREGE